MTLSFDPAASTVTVETRAKGMLAKLAHDLSITAKAVAATAKVDGADVLVELRVTVAKLAVEGILKGSSIDRSGLSSSDKAEIERKIREEVFRGAEVVVSMKAPGEGALSNGKKDVNVSGKIEAGGRSASISSRASIDVTDAGATVSGRAKVSLPGLGITPPKGPLGAFRVDDDVEVVYRLSFTKAI